MTNFDLRELLIRRIRKLPLTAMPDLELAVKEVEDRVSALPAIDAVGSQGAKRQESEGSVKPEHSRWPHAPTHRLSQHGTYIVTGSTLHKQHHFRGEDRLTLLHDKLLELADQYRWQLEAWAVFSNHYHFVAHALAEAGSLKTMLSQLHSTTATAINQLDTDFGREVWHNFWETELTIETSYLARLNYVHQNAVKHGLVKVANQYRWCSAAWFERTATPAQVKTIYNFGIEKVRVRDDF